MTLHFDDTAKRKRSRSREQVLVTQAEAFSLIRRHIKLRKGIGNFLTSAESSCAYVDPKVLLGAGWHHKNTFAQIALIAPENESLIQKSTDRYALSFVHILSKSQD